VKFCVKEVFKCRERRMMRWDEVLTKAQAWGWPCHPKKYLRGTSVKAWGCHEAPLLHRQKSVIFQDTIFLLLRILCVFLGSSLLLLSVLFFVVVINGCTPTYSFWRRHTPFFITKNTLVFTLIVQRVFSFSSTAFNFHFLPWFLFRSCYIFISRCL
jgi:hypothetical protein